MKTRNGSLSESQIDQKMEIKDKIWSNKSMICELNNKKTVFIRQLEIHIWVFRIEEGYLDGGLDRAITHNHYNSTRHPIQYRKYSPMFFARKLSKHQ